MNGNKLYHARARAALPILVRQAKAGEPIYYERLANELGMTNPRNLNYPLGSIGRSIKALSKEWKQDVPMIQSLVINQQQGLPGDGIGGFIKNSKANYHKLTKQQRRELFKAIQFEVYAYRDWDKVLSALGLKPVEDNFEPLVCAAQSFGGGGESEDHFRLKMYVKKNPDLLSIRSPGKADTEVSLASGDCLDVSFSGKRTWTAVEVKSAISSEADLVRGLFQVVKYQAVMSAEISARGFQKDIDVFLVIEGNFSERFYSLANTLGVRVVRVQKNGDEYVVIRS
ncbi:hypothetical protein NHF56_00030 [Rhizobium sp. L1K21]|nr:hypothetical protein [Rhizobium sp. L1K21]